ncbi:replication initiator [Cellulomonas aerilata]|uniref:Replication initiation protein n=1 Tax=Cellulomonas aerilata TaxID=515326 RepID=A0A512DET3_9CELL|nr:replication initiator [Cellulomonas aerilata]GEO34965.1 replication initiation protein [Cellulomonas aerilata]
MSEPPGLRTFPGYTEDEGLDLGHLSATAVGAIVQRIADGSAALFADVAASVGYCSKPVRLVGSSHTVDGRTGEIVGSFSSDGAPLGVVYRPCGNRRADVCAACSRVYARDTFAMVRAGLLGGKTVPQEVASNPLVFATLTAPSFGYVHGVRATGGHPTGGRCRPRDTANRCEHGRPVGCMTVHTDDDPAVGGPLCVDCYDWASAVVWQWWAPELWRRFTITLRRSLASRLGVSESRLKGRASVQFAKVAEFQARGLVHFHALVRLDGPGGAGSRAPLDGGTLADLIREAAGSVSFVAPPVDGADVSRRLAFGAQLDARTVRTGLPADDDDDDSLRAEQVAGYLAKYATKSTGTDPASPRPHLTRLAHTCRAFAQRAASSDPAGDHEAADDASEQGRPSPYALLGKWAHMLGFRGHFSTKSRRYSVTLGRLRRARHRYRQVTANAARNGVALDTRDLEARLLADDETTLVIGSWSFQGSGWTNAGDKALADAAAARAREYARWRAEGKSTSNR